jgi:hypothetical protein
MGRIYAGEGTPSTREPEWAGFAGGRAEAEAAAPIDGRDFLE